MARLVAAAQAPRLTVLAGLALAQRQHRLAVAQALELQAQLLQQHAGVGVHPVVRHSHRAGARVVQAQVGGREGSRYGVTRSQRQRGIEGQLGVLQALFDLGGQAGSAAGLVVQQFHPAMGPAGLNEGGQ